MLFGAKVCEESIKTAYSDLSPAPPYHTDDTRATTQKKHRPTRGRKKGVKILFYYFILLDIKVWVEEC